MRATTTLVVLQKDGNLGHNEMAFATAHLPKTEITEVFSGTNDPTRYRSMERAQELFKTTWYKPTLRSSKALDEMLLGKEVLHFQKNMHDYKYARLIKLLKEGWFRDDTKQVLEIIR